MKAEYFFVVLFLSIVFMFLNAWVWLRYRQNAWLSALSAVVLFLVNFVLGIWISVLKYQGQLGRLW